MYKYLIVFYKYLIFNNNVQPSGSKYVPFRALGIADITDTKKNCVRCKIRLYLDLFYVKS